MALVYWSHRENIGRLARGEEKPWQKKHHDAAPTGCAADTASTTSSDQADLADLTDRADGADGQAPCGCGCAAHGEPGATPEK